MSEGDDRSIDKELNTDEENYVVHITDEMKEDLREIEWQRIQSMIAEYEQLGTPKLLDLFRETAFWVYCLSFGSYEATVLNTTRLILNERGYDEEVNRITEKIKTEGRKMVEDLEREWRAKSRREQMV